MRNSVCSSLVCSCGMSLCRARLAWHAHSSIFRSFRIKTIPFLSVLRPFSNTPPTPNLNVMSVEKCLSANTDLHYGENVTAQQRRWHIPGEKPETTASTETPDCVDECGGTVCVTTFTSTTTANLIFHTISDRND